MVFVLRRVASTGPQKPPQIRGRTTPLIVHAIKFALDRWVTRAEIPPRTSLYADGVPTWGSTATNRSDPAALQVFLRGRERRARARIRTENKRVRNGFLNPGNTASVVFIMGIEWRQISISERSIC